MLKTGGSIQVLADGRLQTDYGVMPAPKWFDGVLSVESARRLDAWARSRYNRNYSFG